MGTITDAATLRSLYAPIRENPNARRAKMLTGMMDKSGYAAPLLAYAAGKEMAGAEAWDADREMKAEEAQAATVSQAAAAADDSYFDKMFGHILKMAQKQPGVAKVMLVNEIENGNNKRFKSLPPAEKIASVWSDGAMGGISLKDGAIWGFDGADGTPKIWRPAAPGADGKPTGSWEAPTQADLDAAIKPTKQDPPKSREVQRGGMKVTEEWNEETKTWREIGKGPAWKPGEGEGKPPTPTTSQKELEQINRERAAAGQPPLSMEEYKADPIITQIVKEQLNKKKPAAPAKAPAPPKGAAMPGELSPDGKSITVGVTLYPIGADGTVIVNGKKYKVK